AGDVRGPEVMDLVSVQIFHAVLHLRGGEGSNDGACVTLIVRDVVVTPRGPGRGADDSQERQEKEAGEDRAPTGSAADQTSHRGKYIRVKPVAKSVSIF